jgi:hypothetical protein
MAGADGFERTIAGLEESLRVSHVATSPLRASFPGQTALSVRAWAREDAINNVPVRFDGEVIGVVENILGDLSPETGATPPPDDGTRIEQAMRRLAGDMLIEGAQPLAVLIDELLRPPHYRLVLVGGRLEAIVTPSDLGKLPMRVLVYTQIAHLEATMTDAIRRAYATEEDAISALDEGSQAQVYGSLGGMHAKNLDPSLLEVASLKQKAVILAAAGASLASPTTLRPTSRTSTSACATR